MKSIVSASDIPEWKYFLVNFGSLPRHFHRPFKSAISPPIGSLLGSNYFAIYFRTDLCNFKLGDSAVRNLADYIFNQLSGAASGDIVINPCRRLLFYWLTNGPEGSPARPAVFCFKKRPPRHPTAGNAIRDSVPGKSAYYFCSRYPIELI